MLIWFAFVFILFSLSGTKLHHYIIYGYSPLCILGGWYAANNKRLPIVWPSFVLLVLLAVMPSLIQGIIPKIDDQYAVEILKNVSFEFDIFYAIAMLVLITILIIIWVKEDWDLQIRMGVVGVIMLFTINILWMPRLGALLQQPVKDAALLAKKNKFENLVIFNHYNPSFHFYSGLYASDREPKAGEVVFGRKPRLNEYPIDTVYYQKYGIILAKVGSK